MKIKKIIVVLISIICFVGIGITLSIQQSQRADQMLNNNGLSTKYYVYSVKKNKKVKDLINFLDHKVDNKHLQVHLKSKYDNNRILIWANYNINSQPLARSSSRYFTKSDFTSSIPMAVISAQTKEGVVTFQGHHYLKENNSYVSVIGQLKSNSESENSQKVYYLTTGINQPTANESLVNYEVAVDGLNDKQAENVKKFLGGSQEIVDFAKTYNRQHGINPTKKFIFAVVCAIGALITSGCMAILDKSRTKLSFDKNNIFSYLLRSKLLKYSLMELLEVLAIFLVLQFSIFFSDKMQLLIIYAILWLLQVFTYAMGLFFYRREKLDE